jgi:hypothetical protein
MTRRGASTEWRAESFPHRLLTTGLQVQREYAGRSAQLLFASQESCKRMRLMKEISHCKSAMVWAG